jgi:hypothetical protein
MSQSWHLCPFKEIVSHGGIKFKKIPALRDKVGIILVLHGRRKCDDDLYPAQGEKFRVAFVLS